MIAALFRGYLLFLGAGILQFFVMQWLYEPTYVVDVQRNAVSTEEEAYIALAESVCPPYEDVIAEFGGTPPAPSEECLWWYDEYMTPYAITSGAIDYYVNLVREAESEESESSAFFRYEVHVEYG
ncbi:MAG: hypothetical protein HYV26_13075 [Candidatus Hydrogenedentes bacterium]|nr:hypothetical protein [Candidatus Hydrogenedentota bacterium]MBI3117350.1 hypothetical protein [Candidatus Hydrogenedentota bacterium]